MMDAKKQLSSLKDSPPQDSAEIRRRPGGRSARFHAAVIEATLAMMEAGEMPRVEEVARRAGVQKSSIYRRWETIGGLVFEAVGMKARLTMPLPDTGSCQDDLRT